MRLVARTAALLLVLSGGAAPLAAQELALQDASFADDQWLARSEPIRLELDRPLAPGEGRLAVFVGPTDITGLVKVEGNALSYDPSLVPLSSGEHEVVIYRVDPAGEWHELGRRWLRVLTPGGFRAAEFDPHLDLTLESQVAEYHSSDAGSPRRKQSLRGTGSGGFTARLERGDWELSARGSIVGSSFQEEALRFAQKEKGAPRVDLSDYWLQLSRGPATFELGHVSYGDHRHLVQSLFRRGVRMHYELHDRIDLTSVFVSGNDVVGWNNISGLDDSDNTIASATLGLDLLRSETSQARLEASYLTGSVAPLSNFNRGQVLDAEKSRGWGLKLDANTWSGRARTNLSFARSSFDNPDDDNQLLQGVGATSVRTVTENAYWAQAAVDVVRDWEVFANRYANATLYGSWERVEPQFKSLGVFTNSNIDTPQVGMRVDLGGASVQVDYARARDNLDGLDTILTTKTRSLAVTHFLPLPVLVGGWSEPFAWLPNVTYVFNRVRQFGSNDPGAGSGFSASSIPKQRDTSHNVSLDWNIERWSAAYRFFHSFQDNQQDGRENADFTERSQQIELGYRPLDTLYLSASGLRSRQRARDLALSRRIITGTFGADWEFLPGWSASTYLSRTRESDSKGTAVRQTATIDAQLAYQFELPVRDRVRPGRVYVRFARQSDRSEDRVFFFDQRIANWTVTTGVSLSVF